jgi:CheY-like chemotaxis protein
MGGDIAVSSTPGMGSCFTLRLPLPETGSEPSPYNHHAAPATPRLSGLRILAAEDVEVNRILLEDLLRHEGASVVFGENGQQALDCVRVEGARSFDVVLMDVQMPVMGGHEAARHIHAIAPDLPIIGLTAHALEEERSQCLASGMVDHVTKPVVPDVLVRTILHWTQSGNAAAAPAAVQEAADTPTSSLPASPDRAPSDIRAQPTAPEAEIDWEAFRRHCRNRDALMARLVQTALDNYMETPRLLLAHADAGDYEKIGFISHALKSFAGNLCAPAVQALATQVNLDAKARSPDAIAGTRQLAQRLAHMLEELGAHQSPAA